MSDARIDRTALRRSRSAPDVPLDSNRRSFSDALNNPQSAGPSFSHSHSFSFGRAAGEDVTMNGRGSMGSPPTGSIASPPASAIYNSPRRTEGGRAQEDTAQDRPPPRQYHPQRSFIYRAMIYLGYGRGASPNRKILVSLIWNIAWGFAQIVTIVGLLAYAATKDSPSQVGVNEWGACSRPLGVWSCLWIGRVLVACILSYWGWKRDKTTRSYRTDVETGTYIHAVPPSSNSGTPQASNASANSRRNNHQRNGNSSSSSALENHPPLPHTVAFRRLSLFSSLYSLSWFLTAHILVYTSVKSCRYSSPHLWWLVFSILCITYLMILEVIILGLVVFIIGPFILASSVLLLVWNIFLICLGRHPLQNPHMIKPEIGKLPKSAVDRIPLVMYIPPPPDAPPTEGPIKVPEAAYQYPPKSPQTAAPSARSKRRFKFIGRFAKSNKKEGAAKKTDAQDGKNEDEGDSWEAHWEKEGFPFVILENNRAACAICLMDFEEPRRKKVDDKLPGIQETLVESTPTLGKDQTTTTGPQAESITEEERECDAANLKLEDAGDGAQPLRLLTCGHVFHKTCLDPWLTDVSGRCPVCQRPVELPEPEKKKKRSRS